MPNIEHLQLAQESLYRQKVTLSCIIFAWNRRLISIPEAIGPQLSDEVYHAVCDAWPRQTNCYFLGR